MGKIFRTYLSGSKVYACSSCKSHLTSADEIVSKTFTGKHGKAYLFAHVVNVCCGPQEERVLMTGLHVVTDVYCTVCQNVLGWKYTEAYNDSQKYKENKFVLEKTMIVKTPST